jgi:hypothetical protein
MLDKEARMSSLKETMAQLNRAWITIHQHWGETKTVWNDSVRWDFEKDYWIPLENQVLSAQRELERLEQIIAQARQSLR